LKVTKTNTSDSISHNKEYNDYLRTLVEPIFCSETLGAIGYIDSKCYDHERYPVINSDNVIREVFAKPKDKKDLPEISFVDMGKCEKIIISSLLYGDYTTNVLIGAVGSGKSAIANEVLKRMKNKIMHCNSCKHKSSIHINIDFNTYLTIDDPEIVREHFREELFDELCVRFDEIFNEYDLISSFFEFTKKHKDKASKFFYFYEDYVDQENWLKKSNKERRKIFFRWIRSRIKETQKKTIDYSSGIRLLGVLAGFVKEIIEMKNSCIVFLFDNIDKVIPEAQYDILDDILSFQMSCKIKTLVPMRMTSFENLNEIGYNSNLVGIIQHNGPSALEIFIKRLRDYYNNKEKKKYKEQTNHIEETYLNYFNNRAKQILDLEPNGRALRTLSDISGFSIRRCLRVCKRIFINNVIPYNGTKLIENDIIRSLLISSRKREINFEWNDSYSSNIFVNPNNNKFSLLPLRIILMVNDINNQKRACLLRKLLTDLKDINEEWSYEDIMGVLNYLMKPGKKLIWMDGRHEFKRIDEMEASRITRLNVTEAGKNYIKSLIRNVAYLQASLTEVDWPDGANLPLFCDYSNKRERFDLLRMFIKEIIMEDKKQLVSFMDWLEIKQTNKNEYNLILISRDILLYAAVAFFDIHEKESKDNFKRLEEEYKNWLNLLISFEVVQKKLLRKNDKKLERLIDRVQQKFKNVASNTK
jgi:hypothetical protein